MSKKQIKRVNKSKKEIVSEIQLNQTAEKMRSLIKNEVYPFLVKNNESIAYNKLFLQSLSGLVNTIYENKTKTITINDLMPEITTKLHSIFSTKDEVQKVELERYTNFFNLIKEVSVYDLTFITEIPRYIDGYLLQEKGKEKINSISIDKLLG